MMARVEGRQVPDRQGFDGLTLAQLMEVSRAGRECCGHQGLRDSQGQGLRHRRRDRGSTGDDRHDLSGGSHYHEEQDEWFYCLAGAYVVEIGDRRFRLGPGDSVLGPRRVPHAFVYDAAGPGRILIGFTPAGRIEQFFRDLEKRGEYFGNGSPEDKERARRLYGIVNVGPPLKL
jgi:mannose-6-phosphate isomerase-like protein (cupin superfamily)